jgi:serine/threonine protein kinase
LARLAREAQVLALLNHPNMAAIAKARSGGRPQPIRSASTTVTMRANMAGTIRRTPGYMAPALKRQKSSFKAN